MGLEIEKKFLVNDFGKLFEILKNDFGKNKYESKAGFWWCSNLSGLENMLEINNTKFFIKDLTIIKEICEINIPIENFHYLRIRIIDNNKYIITFKTKIIINNIEQNTEYEFEVDIETLKRIIQYLKETCLIFYYNIKKTWKFYENDVVIELSKFNDLKDAYLEIEAFGNNENDLHNKLNFALRKINLYNLMEETKNYAELSHIENKQKLKHMKLSQYSREAYKSLIEKI